MFGLAETQTSSGFILLVARFFLLHLSATHVLQATLLDALGFGFVVCFCLGLGLSFCFSGLFGLFALYFRVLGGIPGFENLCKVVLAKWVSIGRRIG